jgi:hypothetical protein
LAGDCCLRYIGRAASSSSNLANNEIFGFTTTNATVSYLGVNSISEFIVGQKLELAFERVENRVYKEEIFPRSKDSKKLDALGGFDGVIITGNEKKCDCSSNTN